MLNQNFSKDAILRLSRPLFQMNRRSHWISSVQTLLHNAQANYSIPNHPLSMKIPVSIAPLQKRLCSISSEEATTSVSEDKASLTPTPPTSASENVLPDKLYKTIELELLAYEPAVIDSYQWFILTAASHLGIEVGKVWAPRKSDKWRFPLLKSAHIHKKHQVHYELRTYHRFITLKKLTGSTASTYLEYIERNLPEGIGMKVSKLEVLPKPDYMNESSNPQSK